MIGMKNDNQLTVDCTNRGERRFWEAGAIVGEAGAAVEFFGKASSPFCIPVARQC